MRAQVVAARAFEQVHVVAVAELEPRETGQVRDPAHAERLDVEARAGLDERPRDLDGDVLEAAGGHAGSVPFGSVSVRLEDLRVLAVDWSGSDTAARERIWVAEARAGQLVRLESGAGRDVLHGLAEPGEHAVVGVDFAFGFPAWFVRARGCAAIDEVWALAARDGEAWLAACEPPFWGRPERPRPAVVEGQGQFRRCDVDARSAKSVFQIGGAGAVGTGSIRGMAELDRLWRAGAGVWPFRSGWPLLVEIYPRLLTGSVRKSRWRDRLAYLRERFGGLSTTMRERAAGSEDAFDAAVSALVMDAHRAELAALRPTTDPLERIEGRIWQPSHRERSGAGER
jgi:hypothetical protein